MRARAFFGIVALVSLAVGEVRADDPQVTNEGMTALEEITIALPGNVPLVLVRIPKGTFTMGSPAGERGRDPREGPQHQITISQDYYLGKYEVTQRQWEAVIGRRLFGLLGSNPSHFSSCGPDCPVEMVRWDDVCGGPTGSTCAPMSFIGKLNQLLGTTKFRLPTEAEWELAARAGTTTEFSFSVPMVWDTEYGDFPTAEPWMWWRANSRETPHPVGQKQKNQCGLHDMHGGVQEWVADWFGDYSPSGATDPTGPVSGARRVSRGGGWAGPSRNCRSAARDHDLPGSRYGFIGFRLARSL
jgi:formylglycine-generating enzyme required for sulfatase activity